LVLFNYFKKAKDIIANVPGLKPENCNKDHSLLTSFCGSRNKSVLALSILWLIGNKNNAASIIS